ncbi:hypothetical protein [Paenisporosarcina sp. TG20]|uniref:hypothetical protein n=1 Tax=Paenisporosarcina sp. TG20 TaxID=1211706 RepID=UPI000379C650|nr:hypothetical protein [Paenisporosarcina sp. TG20]
MLSSLYQRLFSVSTKRDYFCVLNNFRPRDENKAINSLYPETETDVIQDTILLDKRHAYVQFITDEGKYGMSFWSLTIRVLGMKTINFVAIQLGLTMYMEKTIFHFTHLFGRLS